MSTTLKTLDANAARKLESSPNPTLHGHPLPRPILPPSPPPAKNPPKPHTRLNPQAYTQSPKTTSSPFSSSSHLPRPSYTFSGRSCLPSGPTAKASAVPLAVTSPPAAPHRLYHLRAAVRHPPSSSPSTLDQPLCSRTVQLYTSLSPPPTPSSSTPPAIAALLSLKPFRSPPPSPPMLHSAAHNESDGGPRRTYQVVVATTPSMGISKDGEIPWTLPNDVRFFHDLTIATKDPSKKNAVVMGRKTWESTPPTHRPLRDRLNVVLTRSGSFDIAAVENVLTCGSLDSALDLLASSPYCFTVETVFLIGGGQVLRDTLNGPNCDAIHCTHITTNFECDVFIPSVDFSSFKLWYLSFPSVENNIEYWFATYVRPKGLAVALPPNNVKNFSFLPKMVFGRHEEFNYLNTVRDIIFNGIPKNDRTGTGTISKFGCQMRFNLRRYFPLLTTKKVFWRGVVEELLWFVSGSTNAKVLQDKGIHIWDGNACREYLDSIGLTDREEGDLGPVYGFQWRHFGAKYTDMHADYTGKGIDQLVGVIDKIKNNPDDRRIILSSWNPSDLKLMALPPCHMFAQFYVANGELSCQMYQRSADMGLGVPFNIASYSLLTCMIAQVSDLRPGDFVHTIGDAHVYNTHIKPLKEQLQKQPRPFPILKVNPQKKDIDSFVASDFELAGYDPHGKIEMKMAV